ncbi:MAG TPA: YXWGXW repeat-containing protein [Caldimonas sp.]|jgi:hypothetical protein
MLSKLRTLSVLVAASATMSIAAAAAVVDVRIAPPPLHHEVVPATREGYVWTPGYWDWRSQQHVWVSGHWQRARHGYHYRNPEWAQEGDHWRLTRGGWDRDHDGVPDAVDHHPDNPRRP